MQLLIQRKKGWNRFHASGFEVDDKSDLRFLSVFLWLKFSLTCTDI